VPRPRKWTVSSRDGPEVGGVHPALIEGLLRPEAYPHVVATPIQIAETHISWVLLTGDFAYKVKKPLRLNFLDYSTLERRHAFCEEELRLNRRHAPELYLGVSPIGGSEGAPRIDASGPVLEYAVRMRQFDRREELSALLAADAVNTESLADLGGTVARLHADAAVADDPHFGDPTTLRRIVFANFDELRKLPECAARAADMRRLEASVARALDAADERVIERKTQGRVRECHGDLHCGNIVRWRGRLIPFDGIEFDPGLRWIDVMNDLAFLTMDLAERDRRDLRLGALQAWCETLGDFEGLRLLPAYECYRALVRAKVAALAARQASDGPGNRCTSVADCLRHLEWAAARLRPRRPALLLTCGLSGSGKTWLARRLAPALDALHLRSDVERKRLAGLSPLADSRSQSGEGIYTLEFNERTYARLRSCAEAALAGGENVVVDAAFLRRHERESFADLAARSDATFTILHSTAPAALLRQRVAERSTRRDDASEAGLDVLARQPGHWEDFHAGEQTSVISIDTSRDGVVDTALAAIRSFAS
jgi:aminoglycoside phosphotransferase family enzyme/predicted kinase